MAGEIENYSVEAVEIVIAVRYLRDLISRQVKPKASLHRKTSTPVEVAKISTLAPKDLSRGFPSPALRTTARSSREKGE